MPTSTLTDLQNNLGYTFTTPRLLQTALTHRSFGAEHYERLEFLGDSVLNCAVGTLLYKRLPTLPEGELSRLRATLVNQPALAGIAGELGLGDLLRLGEGEVKSGGRARPSILADAVEAILGAIYLEAGFERASQVIEKLVVTHIEGFKTGVPMKDAKTTLQEWLQARQRPLPVYAVKRIDGAAHQQTFVVSCVVNELATVEGSGVSRRAAEQAAAANAIERVLSANVSTATGNRHE